MPDTPSRRELLGKLELARRHIDLALDELSLREIQSLVADIEAQLVASENEK